MLVSMECAGGSGGGAPTIDVVIPPNMTSNSYGGYVASVNYTPYGSTPAYYAFDGQTNTALYGPTSGTYAQLELWSPIPVKPTEFDYLVGGTGTTIALYGIYGSYSDNEYDVLYSGTPSFNSMQEIPINTDKMYCHFRFEVTGGSPTSTPAIAEIKIKGKTFDYS